MSNSAPKRLSMFASLNGLVWPFALGSILSAIYYFCVLAGPLRSDYLYRYTASHPVLYLEVVLFFVGIASLALKLQDVLGQQASLGRVVFDDPPEEGQPVESCGVLLDVLNQLPAKLQGGYLVQRLRAALELLERKGTTAGLDEELKYLADGDANRQSEGYSLVRIVIWATPMLGFLGTVVGITEALGDLGSQDLGANLQGAMKGLLAGLYVAFDTTALALTLSMVLMFLQYGIERAETQLLAAVDRRVDEELLGRFVADEHASDPQVAVIQHMAQSVVKSTEQLVERQAMVWKAALDDGHETWSHLLHSSGEQVRTALTIALEQSLEAHADRLAESEKAAADEARGQWEKWQTVLNENARLLHAQQQELIKQGELMTRMVEATGDVIKLEDALNENLKALAGARNFEDTVMSLSAAIHLLSARLEPTVSPTTRIDLGSVHARGRAA